MEFQIYTTFVNSRNWIWWPNHLQTQLQYSLPCYLQNGLRTPARRRVWRKLQEKMFHRIQKCRYGRKSWILLYTVREKLWHTRTGSLHNWVQIWMYHKVVWDFFDDFFDRFWQFFGYICGFLAVSCPNDQIVKLSKNQSIKIWNCAHKAPSTIRILRV